MISCSLVKRLPPGILLPPLLLLPLARADAPRVPEAPPWTADRGDGTYRNPVLHADYSDPDVVRAGDDYYMTASSFNCAPGLPILHSRDLVNWRLVGHALPRQVPEDHFSVPRHGQGCWAPSFRFHAGRFWIYYPDPDFGIYVVTATDPTGEWSRPVLVKAGKGLIDPSPLWDDDGQVYLVHAWAKSRAGFNNVLTLVRLSADGLRAQDEGKVVIDGNALPGYQTLEGPKLYKRDGWYYVFAPAGGVKQGWQSVFRARSIQGPYQERIVLHQGATDVNGPHQGAWVTTASGEDWFFHFQDKEAYGRVVHLQPMTWRQDGWPVMGADPDGDGRGEPVPTWRKPRLPAGPVSVPATSDEFDRAPLGLQWQWQANPGEGWASFSERAGWLRLRAQPVPSPNLWLAPHVLLQKWPAPEFTATARLRVAPAAPGEAAGLAVFGHDYAWIGLEQAQAQAEARRLVVRTCTEARSGTPETEAAAVDLDAAEVVLRVAVRVGGRCRFSYSRDGRSFQPLGGEFTARPGHWIGAKVGLFARAAPAAPRAGHVDVDWFRVDTGDDRR
jgi:beta-xylosidase